MQVSYDAKRQQMTNMFIRRTSNTGTDNVIINSSYDYYNGGANNGRIQKITDNTDVAYTTTYGYDAYNRLTSATATAFTRSYGYDNWGNLTGVASTGVGETGSYSLSYATNASGAPATNRINNAGFSYDNAGNQTAGDGWTYAYDAANRLKSAGASGNTYGYDGDGHKVKQDTGGYGNVYYLWSSVLGQPVVEATTGGIYRAYVYGPSGQSLGLLSYDSQFYRVHSDHLGSGRKLTDVNGNVTYRGEFDPHGQTLLEVAPGGTYLNSRKFTGYERNWATNLDYANARFYHHNRNRFMQPDPLGVAAADTTNSQSFNRYSYVGNDPANFVDPSGLYIESWLECDRKVTSYDQFGNIADTTTYCTLHIAIYGSSGSIGGGNDIFSGGGSDPVTKSSDKLRKDELPSPNDPNLDDCKKKGEAISEVFKSVRRRRVELSRDSESYRSHADVWGKQKNILNKWISNFRGNNCKDDDLPPGSPMRDVVYEAAAPSPPITNARQFINSGGLVPAAVAVITVGIFLPWLLPSAGTASATSGKPVPVPVH